MSKLIDSLPKCPEGDICLSPAGDVEGVVKDGTGSVDWFNANYNSLANEMVPLTSDKFNELKAIGQYWSQNADRWRTEGIV